MESTHHHTIATMAAKHPAYPESALRNLIFKHDERLTKSGAIYRRGKRVIIIEERFLEAMAATTEAA